MRTADRCALQFEMISTLSLRATCASSAVPHLVRVRPFTHVKTLIIFLILAVPLEVDAAPKHVRVFVALCDNKTQGIVPVGAKIGNGDDPDANLYWGCSDGLGSYFRQSGRWQVAKSEQNLSSTILRRLELTHADGDVNVIAEAYRG